MDLEKIGWGDVDWIGVAQDRDKWTAFVSAVTTLWVHYNAGKVTSQLVASQVVLSSAEFVDL
jgi:hypothetical protein